MSLLFFVVAALIAGLFLSGLLALVWSGLPAKVLMFALGMLFGVELAERLDRIEW